ncbi:SdrD B-like domain-containing protein [Listeria riparia]|uniref:Putative collagen-binding protein n=1 Tax=Listeria riparia FSL S10-1204 TaxID=1265816 RepID=W7D581_9LIST|nr:SdrD B-like domain-containing protein [Listeria riparia]EUJ44342.1 putative collagen-binding protein [Listeria riparia FSL S10-1204]
MSKKGMKKWGIGAITGVLVLGSLTPIIQPYTTVSAAENTIKQLKASGEGSISDVMFEDLNGNAVQDSNETTGVAGIKVELYSDQGILIGTATTGTDGRYTFSNVPDGTYYLHVDMSTLPSDEKLYTTKGINGSDGNSSYFTISGGNTITGYHFGFYPEQGAIQSFVYNDANGNGQKDSGEAGISGVHVALYSEVGAKVADATTDSTGAYSFNAIKPGRYYAKADIPANYKYQSSTYFGSDGATNYFTVASEQTLRNELNLGLVAKNNSAISGLVTDATTSTGIANIRVELHDVQGNLITTVQTDSSGRYGFEGLAAGNYYTKVIIPSNYNFVSSNGYGSDGNSNYISLTGSNTASSYSISLRKQANTTISGVINTPSGQGVSENVSLYNVDGTLVKTVTTSTQGNFSFTGIAAGNYYVKATIPEGYTFDSSQGFGSDGNSYYLQADGTTNISNLRLTLAQKTGQIRSTVFNDLNKNGTQEVGESGVAGVSVTLYSNTGAVIETTTTDANGLYKFETVTPGTYYVRVTPPTGYKNLANTAFGSDGVSGYISVAAQQTRTDMNAALISTAIVATDLTLNTTDINTTVNATGKIDATVQPTDTTNKTLSYTPADSSIISVDANGNWTAKKAGTTTIAVKTTDGSNITKTVNVTVTDPNAVSSMKWIYQNGWAPDTNIANGDNITVSNTYKDGYGNDQIDVAMYNSAGTQLDQDQFTYTLSNPSLLSVRKATWLTVFGHTEQTGSTLVTVKDAKGNTVRTFTINITGPANIPATGIDLTTANINTTVGKTGTIAATVQPANATNKTLSYTPADSSIISVDANGNWTAKKAGTTTVQVKTTDGTNITKTVNVTVTDPVVLATDINLATTNINTTVGTTGAISATVQPSNTTNKTLTYTPTDSSIISVDANGNWTAKKAGTTTIAVKTTDGSNITKTVNVTVTDPVILATDITLAATNITADVNDTGKVDATVLPTNATNKKLTYTSNDTNIITVDANGNWVAKKGGGTTITVTTTDGSNISKTITVRVNGENMIVNPEFNGLGQWGETAYTGAIGTQADNLYNYSGAVGTWTTVSKGILGPQMDIKPNGNGSVDMKSGANHAGLLAQTVATIPGHQYSFKYVATDGGHGYYNATVISGSQISTGQTLAADRGTLTGGWKQPTGTLTTLNFTATTTSTTVYFVELGGYGLLTSGIVNFSNISLVDVTGIN